jgi:diguanylate cyclase (GGDEF)-like protein
MRHTLERQQYRVELASLTNNLRDASEQLEQLSLTDPLTGLLNRRGLQEVLSRELPLPLQGDSKHLALLLDLDDFKRINDTWGFSAGDFLLKDIARRIRESLRLSDYAARVAGDKFIVLMPRTPMTRGGKIAERIRLAVSGDPISTSLGQAVHVTASLGMIHIAGGFRSVEEILDKTYLILQHSKKAGKNRLSYERSGKSHKTEHSRTGDSLVSALSQPEAYRAAAQPIVDLGAEEPVGYEFLARSTIEGFELPDDFFHVCMEHNILTLADHYCLKACLKAARSLPYGLRRHVNLFPSTLIGIPIEQLLEELPCDAANPSCCVEISEKQIINDPTSIEGPVKALREAGVLIAIDDTGFGRTCLESLTILEPDIIKIDRKCVTGIGQNPEMINPLKRLIKVAQALNAEVIAEGIETESDREILFDLGVRYGQGYLWGKPALKTASDLWPFHRQPSRCHQSA